eukprot:m.21884 g.21884  ORF g.21884 m.21884 type:complete len:462 (-) comp7265_c0_seq1:152-1537(-)
MQSMWWTRDIYNWNLVSNGGMVPTALSVADYNTSVKELADFVLTRSLEAMKIALPSWNPQGVWPEGSGYWAFAMQHTILAAASCTTALNHDCDIFKYEGLKGAALYYFYLHGPSMTIFNWADCEAGVGSPWEIFYLSRLANTTEEQRVLSAAGRMLSKATDPTWQTIAYWNSDGTASDIYSLPRSKAFLDKSTDRSYGRKTHLGFFRSCWNCTADKTVWLAFKGGENHFDDHGSDSHNNHGHLDLGHFVFEMEGERWAIDLGAGQYDFPDLAYFGRFRWGYYHTSSFGHNVLSFDGQSQNRFGNAEIYFFEETPTQSTAHINLTSGYGLSERVTRTFSLIKNTTVMVHDEWNYTMARKVEWRMHTVANMTVESDKQSHVELSINGKTIYGMILEPLNAKFHVEKLNLPNPQISENRGSLYNEFPINVLTVKLDSSYGQVSIAFSKDIHDMKNLGENENLQN